MDLSKLRARMGTRKLAGVEIPRQNRTSVAFRKAMAADGGDHDGITGGHGVRLCRASGGRVKRQDGGSTISEDSKKEAAQLRTDAKADRLTRNLSGAAAIGSGIMGVTGNKLQRSGNKPIAAGNAVLAYGAHRSAKAKDAEAERIEKGRVKPGEEDRKCGGPVKRAYGGRAKRNMGGPTLPPNTRLSADSEREAIRLRGGLGKGTVEGAGGHHAGKAGRNQEADRIRRGLVKDGHEDRKHGGKVKESK